MRGIEYSAVQGPRCQLSVVRCPLKVIRCQFCAFSNAQANGIMVLTEN